MADMTRPRITDFDAGDITPMKMLRSMPAELRGVVTNLHDALKELRSCVFRAGQLVLTDGQVATQSWLEADVLARTLPVILQSGFMVRDDEGALFSPHLYARLLRKEEREARKAQADAQWQQWQESGEMPEGISRKAMTARQNGAKGGRPRKEKGHEHTQRHMPLVAALDGGKTETENPNKKPIGFSVMDNSVSSVSIDLESERDNIPSSSISSETEKPKPKLDDALVQQVAARVLTVTGMDDQAGYAISLTRRWLGMGATADTIVSAIQSQLATMQGNGEPPRRLKVFEAAVLRGMEAQKIVQPGVRQTDCQDVQQTEAEKQLEAAWHKATQVWQRAFAECRDYGATMRQWGNLARDNGLPDLPYIRDVYQRHFCGQQAAA